MALCPYLSRHVAYPCVRTELNGSEGSEVRIKMKRESLSRECLCF